ncbi:MAG: methyltransferase domain-containing protein [Verrucomicrobiota bacterium]
MNIWEERWQNGDTPWDRGEAAPPLLEYLEREPVEGLVLVPGCGSGHEVRALAKQGAKVAGMDLARTALEKASSYERIGSETYLMADFLKLPEKLYGSFDWLVEHTCFCAIDPDRREDYVQAAKQALKPGGKLLAIFFISVPDPDHVGPPHMSSLRELDQLFRPHFLTVESWRARRVFPEREDCLEQVRLMVRR